MGSIRKELGYRTQSLYLNTDSSACCLFSKTKKDPIGNKCWHFHGLSLTASKLKGDSDCGDIAAETNSYTEQQIAA
ncbi:hypothetical protein DPMN_137518 [Dreissena polymorpha]|uniref:Uncharacterized protein n=1 Tax=Dreissena polymorpha TaxID=45954 RepID=A0A9D4G2W4_DREPO|nr:hypothetical protein DPMN_137518 [Dreissena polymorpha]